MKSIFDYKGYKPYLKAQLGGAGQRTGRRSALAKHLSCNTAYVSQVLNGGAEFSLEQADRINRFFDHSQEESEVFLLLVQIARAGTKSLKDFFKAQLNETLSKRQNIKKRVEVNKEISPEVENQYYSSWFYAAIHILISIPKYQNKQAICDYLKLDVETVNTVLDFLVKNGMAEQIDAQRFHIGQTFLHLAKDSTNISKLHSNWRQKAMSSLDHLKQRDDLHYSIVVSLSKHDAVLIKERFIEMITANMKTIGDSPEETLYCNVIDFFELKA